MRRTAILTLALLALPASSADDKGTKVTLDDMSSVTPATWVKEKVASSMRTGQFKLAKKGEDKDDAEVVIFALGGGAKANITRWQGQFRGGDEGKVTELKVAGCDATRLEIAGTHTPTPTRPGAKAESKAGYKGVFYYIVGPDKAYQIRLVGPAKTVDAYAKGYDGWVKAFKK